MIFISFLCAGCRKKCFFFFFDARKRRGIKFSVAAEQISKIVIFGGVRVHRNPTRKVSSHFKFLLISSTLSSSPLCTCTHNQIAKNG